MYEEGVYKNLSREEIEKRIRSEGFEPSLIQDDPGYKYPRHKHPEKKLLVFLEGDMNVMVGNETFHCKPGDKLVIGGNIEHEAVVGGGGCIFFWAER